MPGLTGSRRFLSFKASMAVVGKNALLVARADVRYKQMPSGGMLVNVATGACFELNRVAADLWTQVSAGATVAAAIATVGQKYDVALDTVEGDAFRLFRQLTDQGLVDAVASETP